IMALQVVGRHDLGDENDPLNFGVGIVNSEVGAASLSFSSMVFRRICLNGMIFTTRETSYSRKHVGGVDLGAVVTEQMATRSVDGNNMVSVFIRLKAVVIEEPAKVFDKIGERYELTQDQREAITAAYGVEPGNHLYACINAVTRAGNSETLALESRLRLQEVGGRMLEAAGKGRRWLD
ncbi:MAG: hypothetical protein L6Q71_09030, partial [Planctomycetes bacterium]|nr:hypothetical protein [Planctomycetota bacterium]